ncbi:hypothetical protein [Nocardia acidivorans]|uniref:hypothetical protein n=1 Tax=Nocardia acidivorans TaxID=404580 RepID=UPI0012FB3171|nr:hypothetical protein [Nocardia acidivorans]
MTTRITVTLDDRLAEQIREFATADAKTQGNVSEWIAGAARARMLAEEARALAKWQREHPEETAAFYAEREAEHALMHASEAHRHGDAA